MATTRSDHEGYHGLHLALRPSSGGGSPHHVTVDGGKRRLMLASLRYLDTFVKKDGAWLFAERLLYVDWVDERALV
jgi:hypothetical protein